MRKIQRLEVENEILWKILYSRIQNGGVVQRPENSWREDEEQEEIATV